MRHRIWAMFVTRAHVVREDSMQADLGTLLATRAHFVRTESIQTDVVRQHSVNTDIYRYQHGSTARVVHWGASTSCAPIVGHQTQAMQHAMGTTFIGHP